MFLHIRSFLLDYCLSRCRQIAAWFWINKLTKISETSKNLGYPSLDSQNRLLELLRLTNMMNSCLLRPRRSCRNYFKILVVTMLLKLIFAQ